MFYRCHVFGHTIILIMVTVDNESTRVHFETYDRTSERLDLLVRLNGSPKDHHLNPVVGIFPLK